MPNWKKVIVSGSNASLNSLIVDNGITGSLFGTASFAVTSSFVTASNVFGPFGSNSVISSSFALTASYASFADNGGVTQILAGPNIIISPLSGKGQVTISSTGTGSGNFNTATGSYGSFYDTTTQINPVANTAMSMSFNETAITNGVSISGSTNPFNTYIKTENAGVYNLQFSAQLDKTDSGTDSIDIWIRKNGIDLLDTSTTVTLTGNNDKSVAAWNWFVQSAANDYYQIIWSSADTDMRLLAEVSSSVHPGIPSVIATVNRVDQFLSNTGSFNGDFNGAFTGSLFGTASYVLNAVSASFATSASFAQNAVSSSYPIEVSGSSLLSVIPRAGLSGSTSNGIFLGANAGLSASLASNSNFLGQNAGNSASLASNSNFFGTSAGVGARNASNSNFFGQSTGNSAASANNSNFLGQSAGLLATSASNSNFLGQSAGSSATEASQSNFIGFQAGRSATNAAHSNFFGRNAGFSATSASFSTLIGYQAGYNTAGGALGIKSNNIIIGTNITLEHGRQDSINLGAIIFATGSYSNIASNPFSGSANGRVGINVVNPLYTLDVSGSGNYTNGLTVTGSLRISGSVIATNFTGSLFGTASFATSASFAQNAVSSSYPIAVTGSNLYSTNPEAGVPNPGSTNNSVRLGLNAGSASNASDSIMIGEYAGQLATNANNSNFLGSAAGDVATNAYHSNFLGTNAGTTATNADNSNFLGQLAGDAATNASNANFLGNNAGGQAANASSSNFLGLDAGRQATSASNSNFLGSSAGFTATNAANSNFLGYSAGAYATNASSSNFLGLNAGISATNAADSNFIGNNAGNSATNASSSNFLGLAAGDSAANADTSNFLGYYTGQSATNANNSNFLGQFAGAYTTNANNSNFLGPNAGIYAINVSSSNFLGPNAGNSATDAANSNFLGNSAGNYTANAQYSTLIGYQAGLNSTYDYALGIKSNNIIIGTNITLPDGTSNAINLGGLIFGTGSYSTTTGDPFSGSSNGRVGINQPNPQFNFDVSGSGRYTNGLTVSGSTTITGSLGVGTTGSAVVGRIDASNDVVAFATSDINLKENLKPIANALYKLDNIQGYTFDWKQDEKLVSQHGFTGRDIGVIAQEIEEILPEVVTTRDSGYKAVKYEKIVPFLIQCIKELKDEIEELKGAKTPKKTRKPRAKNKPE
jgi:trimeric autotransporter adhesin